MSTSGKTVDLTAVTDKLYNMDPTLLEVVLANGTRRKVIAELLIAP